MQRTQRGVASVYIKLLFVPRACTAAGGEVDFPKSSAKLNIFYTKKKNLRRIQKLPLSAKSHFLFGIHINKVAFRALFISGEALLRQTIKQLHPQAGKLEGLRDFSLSQRKVYLGQRKFSLAQRKNYSGRKKL
ncbi:MAG: hypothetical protein J6M53_08000 [Bacteroidaceae bacterium]|nr:hypothetical protein [Bacteroidaceae bacterium]